MFDPKDHCTAENELGYTVKIHYNKLEKRYYVTGYTVLPSLTPNRTGIQMDADGATQVYTTMAAALADLLNYPAR